jgi:cystathionine beta-synthase
MIVTRYSDLIGNTPLFELVRLHNGTRYLLKLEQFNPTGSMKIRMARQMVLDALADGRLPADGRVVESTSGNTGLGLAVVAAELGLDFTAVVDHHASKDKLRAMTAMGAELVYVAEDGDEGLNTAAREELAEAMAAEDPRAFFTEQHNNDSNPAAYAALARELAADLGEVGYLVCAVGTGGSLFGTARELRRLGQRTQVIGVEPVGSIAFGGTGADYWQSGTGTPEGAVVGTAVDYDLLDEGVKVSDVDAFATARVIGRRTGLLIGGSTGGCVHAALAKLVSLPPGSTVVSIVCDGGEKYLDTVYDDGWMAERDLLDPGAEESVVKVLDSLL